MIVVSCQCCGQKYALPEEAAGTTKSCRKCGARISIPGEVVASVSKQQQHFTLQYAKTGRHPLVWMLLGAVLMAVVITSAQVAWHWYHEDRDKETTYRRSPPPFVDGSKELSNAQKMYDQSIAAIVYIHRFKNGRCTGHGSGFVLFPGKTIVTNNHVIEDADHVIVETYWRQRIKIDRYLAADKSLDLAVLRVPASIKLESLKMAERTHAVGERVYTMGSPEDVRFGISEGVIVRIGQIHGSSQGTIVHCDISTGPGASGSPLLDDDGHVLGVIKAINREKPNYSFSVHVEELRRLLAKEMRFTRFGKL